MTPFQVKPEIYFLDTFDEFVDSLQASDLVVTSSRVIEQYPQLKDNTAYALDIRKYGKAEPTDIMVESMFEEIEGIVYNRVIAIGGGTVLDVGKIFALEKKASIYSLFKKEVPVKKIKELVCIPTTCGTGSEVTNISILEFTKQNTKFGLADDALYANCVYLIPSLLKGLPLKVLSTSAIDALVHSIESYTSPKATPFSELFSEKAMRMILETFKCIVANQMEVKNKHIKKLLYASTYAGIAFGNAGCAAVHALSYPLGAKYHVAHGESNYALFTSVYLKYMEKDPDGKIKKLNKILGQILGCDCQEVYEEIEHLLNYFLPKKAIHEYGVTQEDLIDFTGIVMSQQTRLMNNNYVPLKPSDVLEIYQNVY